MTTEAPAEYQPLPPIEPISDSIRRKYSVDHEAVAVFGQDITTGFEPTTKKPSLLSPR